MLDIVHAKPSPRSMFASRRVFLSTGIAALGLPALVNAEAKNSASQSAPRAKSVILVFLGGGLSHLDGFDPKPDAPEAIRGQYGTIATAVPGLRLGEKLPLLARSMDRFALVRSTSHTSDHHETASNWVLSGRRGSAFGDFPAIGAVVAHDTGFGGPLPAHVATPRNPAFTWELGKSAFLGARCESFKAGDAHSSPELAPEARRAFDIGRECSNVRDRYGRTAVGESMLLARRLVEAGTRFVTVNYAGWDHHANIFEHLDKKLPEFDRSLSALLEDLSERGTLRETLVVAMSEFGRMPTLNRDGGRDHWAAAGSLLVAGAGVNGGQVIGGTDRHGAFPVDRPVTPGDIAATIFAALGIDPNKRLSAEDGRCIAILDRGQPVKELFA